jgi:hypothetical protein
MEQLMTETNSGRTNLQATTDAVSRPSYQAYQILRLGFTVAPVVAGLDKFFHFLVNWD